MFVSSYNTYIHPNNSDKNAKYKTDKYDSKGQTFDSKLLDSAPNVNLKTSNLPIDYILKSQLFNNKQELDFQTGQLQESQDKELVKTKSTLTKFTGTNSMINAKNAYESNSIMFSLFQKPHSTLNQTPKIDKTLPPETQEAKEMNLRHIMVNTYIENDKYYKITA